SKIVAGLLPILYLCGGCATEMTHFESLDGYEPLPPSSGVYRGTRFYGSCIAQIVSPSDEVRSIGDLFVGKSPVLIAIGTVQLGFLTCYLISDVPVSLAADTLILPYDLTTIHNSNEDSDQ